MLRRRAYYSKPVEAFTYRGTLQCMPQNLSSLVVYYNRDLFREGRAGRPAAGLDLRGVPRRRPPAHRAAA